MSEVNSMGDRSAWAEDYTATLAEKADREAAQQRQEAAAKAAVALRAPLVEAGVVQLGLE